MNKREIKANELKGMFIYQNTKNGTVWYDIFTRKGYVITSQETKVYSLYSMCFPASLILAYLCNDILDIPVAACIGIGVAVYVLFKIAYRILFFYKLPVAKGWEKPQEGLIDTVANKFSKLRLIALVVLSALAGVASQIGIRVDNLEGNYKLLMNILTGAAVVLFVVALLALAKKNVKEKTDSK